MKWEKIEYPWKGVNIPDSEIDSRMKLFDDFRSFVLENEFSIHIYENRINIVNYDSIGHFDSR